MTLKMPSNELLPHSTPPGPVIISTRLTSSIGCTRVIDGTLTNGSNSERPSVRNCTACGWPRTSGVGNVEWKMPTRYQPGTESASCSRSWNCRSRISSAVTTVTIAGASCTVVTPLAADCTTLARSSASSTAGAPGSPPSMMTAGTSTSLTCAEATRASNARITKILTARISAT